MNRTIYFDIESGGLEHSHPNIQLAAIAVDKTLAEVETFEAKIAFDPTTADPAALELNHWTAEAWTSAKPEADIARSFTEFLNRHRSVEMMSKRTGKPYSVAKLVGHNAATFDGPRLQAMFKRHGLFLPADPRVRCTCQRAMWWFDERGGAPADFKLATLCAYFSIPVTESHEALADVRLTIALARAMSEITPAMCKMLAGYEESERIAGRPARATDREPAPPHQRWTGPAAEGRSSP